MQDVIAPEVRFVLSQLETIKQRLDARDKLAGERHNALLDKLEGTRREILVQLDLTLAKQKIEQLQARQHPDVPHQAAVGQ